MTRASHGASTVSTAGPTVSVGLPVYNGGDGLERALDSLLAQTLGDLQIVISDNASTDETQRIGEAYAAKDPRIVYVRKTANLGPRPNFESVLSLATGRFFMWLGHDDWLDPRYLERCVAVLTQRPDVSLACGAALYYRDRAMVRRGKRISLTSDDPRLRVLSYLSRVSDNGTFYGVMRREQLLGVPVRDVAGADWLIIASVAYLGKVVTLDEVHVHRGLGGASKSLRSQTDAIALPAWHARWIFVNLPLATFREILWGSDVFRARPLASRAPFAVAAASLTSVRPLIWAMRERFGEPC